MQSCLVSLVDFKNGSVNFSFDFQGQGQRSKVTALEHMVPMIMS